MFFSIKKFSSNKVRALVLIGGAFSGARMLIGATSALFLLSKGLSIADIATLKAIQAFVILVSDVPIGYFADKYDKRISVGCSFVFASMWLILTGLFSNFYGIAIAEVCNALSLTFINGAFDAYLIEVYKQEEKEYDLKNLFSEYYGFEFFVMSLAVLVSGFFPSISSPFLWFLGGGIMIGLLFLFLALFFSDKGVQKKKFHVFSLAHMRSDLRYFVSLLSTQQWFVFLFISYLLINVVYQIFIQYWQVFIQFSAPYPLVATVFSVVFFCILLIQSLAAKMAFRIPLFLNIVFLLGWFFFLLLALSQNIVIFSIGGSIGFFASMRMIQLWVDRHINEIVKDELRATILSLLSSVLRLVLIGVFPFVGKLSLKGMSYVVGVMLLMVSGFGVLWLIRVFFHNQELSDNTEREENASPVEDS